MKDMETIKKKKKFYKIFKVALSEFLYQHGT